MHGTGSFKGKKRLFIMYYINFQMADKHVFLSNHIAWFFDQQYLWKETISGLDFFI